MTIFEELFTRVSDFVEGVVGIDFDEFSCDKYENVHKFLIHWYLSFLTVIVWVKNS